MTYLIKLGEISFPAMRGQTILDAALEHGIAFPYNCMTGACATCRCKLLEGEVRTFIDFTHVLSDDDMQAGWVLACQSTPKTELTIALG